MTKAQGVNANTSGTDVTYSSNLKSDYNIMDNIIII